MIGTNLGQKNKRKITVEKIKEKEAESLARVESKRGSATFAAKRATWHGNADMFHTGHGTRGGTFTRSRAGKIEWRIRRRELSRVSRMISH